MTTPYFDHRSKHYDVEHVAIEPSVERVDQIILDLLEHTTDRPLDMCDLGAGTGRLAKKILSRNPQHRVTLIDFSIGMVERAMAKLAHYDSVSIKNQDLCDVNLASESFDFVYALLALHHLTFSQRMTLYKKVYRALRQDGRMIILERIDEGLPACCVDLHRLIMKDRMSCAVQDGTVIRRTLEQAMDILHNQTTDKELDKRGKDRFTLSGDLQALRDAGFGEIALIWRCFRDSLIYASR